MPVHQRIAILTDSTSDIPADLATARGITIIPFQLRFDHGPFVSCETTPTADLIDAMEHHDAVPTLSSPSVHDFELAFRALAGDADHVIAVLISSRLSSAVKSARIAAKAVHSSVKVDVVDSLNTSFGLGLQVLRAVDLVDQGRSADRIVQQLQSEVTLNHVVFFLETLEHLRRSGRVGKASEMLGTLLQLKPILRIDEGQVIPFERARTRAKALDELITFAQSIPAIDEIAVVYSSSPEDVATILPPLALLVDASRVRSVQFGAALAAHVGPGCVGVAIREKPVM